MSAGTRPAASSTDEERPTIVIALQPNAAYRALSSRAPILGNKSFPYESIGHPGRVNRGLYRVRFDATGLIETDKLSEFIAVVLSRRFVEPPVTRKSPSHLPRPRSRPVASDGSGQNLLVVSATRRADGPVRGD